VIPWGLLWAAIVGAIKGVFGIGAPAKAVPTVIDTLKAKEATDEETQRVVAVGDATELKLVQHPDAARAPDPFSRD
jgi:multidrug efflux pump subunit AcrA (membrane-fusion protein)